MKKVCAAVLMFVLIIELNTVSGQFYYPFPDTLASWSEAGGGCDEPGNPTWCSYDGFHFELAHDTIIDSKVYTLLGYQQSYSYDAIFNGSFWDYFEGNYLLFFPGNIVGAIREDSSKKVWFRALYNSFTVGGFPTMQTFPQDTDILIYDFNLQVGDTVDWKAYSQVVEAIDSIQLLNTDWRKIYQFDWGDFWIEGIGSNLGLFGAYNGPPFEGGYELLCFKKDSILLYENLGYMASSCDQTYLGIGETESSLLSIFPNPANDFIIFDLSAFQHENLKLTIFTSKGQTALMQNTDHSAIIKISTNQLRGNGLYFYTLSIGQNKLVSGKFIIDR
ncbi:MAG: T9SS type A sorting domain-containing protein [Chitinophagales bacterium]|nr:T9SS type A sorting domain-containing protein [Chitinophagales bacterium]